MFHGSIPALITPFRDGIVDERAFQRFVDWQIGQGSTGLVPCGTTGESVTLSYQEHTRLVALCVEAAGGRAPVIAGAGSNNTVAAIELTRAAKQAGAQAVLSVAPYYNRPSQEGIFAHFRAIHDAVDIPIVIYNVPGRTVVDIAVETVARLAQLPNIVGIKDASGDLSRVHRHRELCGEDFVLLSGDDSTGVDFYRLGGSGCISVTANAAPEANARVYAAAHQGDFEVARAGDSKLTPLHKTLFIEPSPAPAKFACSLLGHCHEEVRLPIIPCTAAAKEKVHEAMIRAGLL